jgi:hypothetical protein
MASTVSGPTATASGPAGREPPPHERGRAGRVPGGGRGEQAGRLGGEPALRVLQDRGRGPVEPGEIIDPDEHRGGHGEGPEHAKEGDRDRSLIGRLRPRLGAQQGHVQCPPLRGRQCAEHRRRHRFEQVPERGEAQRGLRLDRAAGEHVPAAVAGLADPGRPQRRLADAGLALEQQPRREAGHLVEEPSEPAQFGGTAVDARVRAGRPLHATPPGSPRPGHPSVAIIESGTGGF